MFKKRASGISKLISCCAQVELWFKQSPKWSIDTVTTFWQSEHCHTVLPMTNIREGTTWQLLSGRYLYWLEYGRGTALLNCLILWNMCNTLWATRNKKNLLHSLILITVRSGPSCNSPFWHHNLRNNDRHPCWSAERLLRDSPHQDRTVNSPSKRIFTTAPKGYWTANPLMSGSTFTFSPRGSPSIDMLGRMINLKNCISHIPVYYYTLNHKSVDSIDLTSFRCCVGKLSYSFYVRRKRQYNLYTVMARREVGWKNQIILWLSLLQYASICYCNIVVPHELF